MRGRGRGRVDREFSRGKREGTFDSIHKRFLLKSNLSFFFFAVMEVNGKEFVEFLPPPINSISNVFSSEEREKKK